MPYFLQLIVGFKGFLMFSGGIEKKHQAVID